jgi:hypothetical protein
MVGGVRQQILRRMDKDIAIFIERHLTRIMNIDDAGIGVTTENNFAVTLPLLSRQETVECHCDRIRFDGIGSIFCPCRTGGC